MVRVTREALLINNLSRIMRVIRSRLMRVKIGSEGGWVKKVGLCCWSEIKKDLERFN